MTKSCIYIPNKKGSNEQSQLFKDLLRITEDYKTTKLMWGLAQNEPLMREAGFKTTEPDAIEFLSSMDNIETILPDRALVNFVQEKEDLANKSYHTGNEAFSKLDELINKYNYLAFNIYSDGNNLKIKAKIKTAEAVNQQRQQVVLNDLNNRLLGYLNGLGFDASYSDELGSSGKFSPLEAKENANGLKDVIQIAKNIKGVEAFPEEFSHVIIEGLGQLQITKSLINNLNEDLVKEILGEDYDTYATLYNNDDLLLRKEAAAKLVAQTILNESGIDSFKLIRSRIVNTAMQKFKNGEISEIDDMLNEAIEQAGKIAEIIGSDEFFKIFDIDAIKSAPTMYKTTNALEKLEEMANRAYTKMNKRIKLLNLRRKKGQITKSEMRSLREMESNLKKKDYAQSIISFLKYASKDSDFLLNQINHFNKQIHNNKEFSNEELRKVFSILRAANTTLQAYGDMVDRFASIRTVDDIKDELSEEDIVTIEEYAQELRNTFNDISAMYKVSRRTGLYKFYEKYYGQERIIKMLNGEEKTLSLDTLLEYSDADVSGFGRLMNSMSDMPDPLLQLVDKVYKQNMDERDKELFELQQELANIQKEYTDATGSRDTSFVLNRGKDGKYTGFYKSDRDYAKYNEDHHNYYLKLKEEYGDDISEIERLLRVWEANHTEFVPYFEGGKRGERMPRLYDKDGNVMYKSNELESLSREERKYYDSIIELKKKIDILLPSRYTKLYKAVQKKVNMQDQVMHLQGGPKAIAKRLRDTVLVSSVDDTEYGEQQRILDFAGNEVKKVPVFYTTLLDDMSLLDTNITDTLMVYGGMAVNYHQVNKIVDAMELTRELLADKDIQQRSGQKKLFEKFKFNGKYFTDDYTKKGLNSQLYKKLENYLEANIYGKRKNVETVHIGDAEINYGKLGDFLKNYSSVLGLGYNVFSGMTNVSMGFVQTMIQSVGGEYFGLGDVIKAHKYYNKYVTGNVAEQYNDFKKNRLTLLLQKFDALEEYYNDLNDTEFNNGIFKKIIGKHSSLIFNSAGEHYLHSISMLAVLNNIKVTINGEQATLYDALVETEQKDDKGHVFRTIEVAPNTKTLDGQTVNAKYLHDVKLKIQAVNHAMHGAFNEVDRGDISRSVMGRWLMNFRQWMPAFYTERFRGSRLNIQTGLEEEGFYWTAIKYLFGSFNDVRHGKFTFISKYKTLSNKAKANMRKAITETGILLGILAMLRLGGGPDKDDPWIVNMLKYNLYRLKTELGAAVPSPLFYDNAKTIIKSPVPVADNMDKILSLIKLHNLFNEIDSGKFEGWSRWEKDFFYAVPYARNIGRLYDISRGDLSMFTPYISNYQY